MHHVDVRPCADRRARLLLMEGVENSRNGIQPRPNHKVDQLANWRTGAGKYLRQMGNYAGRILRSEAGRLARTSANHIRAGNIAVQTETLPISSAG